jgi:hypothetical protein
MIWFTCKKCGKTEGRPETAIGSMIFCECGQGNLVPWESTTAEPPTPPMPAGPPAVPARPVPGALPLSDDPALPDLMPRTRRRPSRRVPDPNYCLNHETVPSRHRCSDCGEAFCEDCLVTFQAQTVCGPCKTLRVRKWMRPQRVSGLAVTSAILALVTGPLAFCLVPFGGGAGGASLLSLLALVPQVAAFALGALALRATETATPRSGRSLAITGMVTAVVAGALTLVVTVLAQRPLG